MKNKFYRYTPTSDELARMDRVVKPRVARLGPGGVTMVSSRTHEIHTAFPGTPIKKLGGILAYYMGQKEGEWDIEVHKTDRLNYWISKKEAG